MADRVRAVFTQTPFRVNFFGGGTDFPDYFNEKRGAVLGTTITKYLYVVVNSLERLLDKRIRLSYSQLESVESPEEIRHDLVRATLLKHEEMINGSFLDIHSYADLPAGTGVGSSSSFTVGFLNALYHLLGSYRKPKEIAKEAIEIERFLLKHAGGWQDQVHAAYGGLNRIDFYDNNFSVSPLYLSGDKQSALEKSCMFFFTGLTRSSANVQQQGIVQADAVAKQEYLAKMYQQVLTAQEILLDSKNPQEMVKDFGALLHEAWLAKKSLASNISNDLIDTAYKVALDAGAHGGKLLGAGGGGFLLFVAPEEKQDDIRRELSRLKCLDIRFERHGSRVIFAN